MESAETNGNLRDANREKRRKWESGLLEKLSW